MVKVSYKQLKATLALGVRKFNVFSWILKLSEFPLFDNFFLELAEFWDLGVFSNFDSFLLFDFANFLIDLLSPSTVSTSLVIST